LDLVSPNFKKDPSLFLKNESTINGVVNEILYDSHGLSVLTPSLPHITSDNQKPREFYRENQIEAHFEPDLEPVKSSGKRKHRKISPLKIHAVDFVHNGESISPINNSKIGNATPPFSNRTFYVKNFLGSGEINTVSYAENLSKGDFDKLSFSAEIKAQEIVDQNASIESINIRREVSKKSNFAPIQIKKLINQDSLYDLDQKKRKENNMWLFDLKEAGKSARPKTYLDVEDKELLTTNLEMKKANSTPFIGGETNLDRKKRNSIQIIETSRLDKSINENGFKTINQYTILNELGRGSFAKVQLGVIWDDEDYKEYAIKVANKKKLKRKLFTKQKNAFTQIQAEIAMLKKTCHPNIIQLYEVIDNPEKDKLYLVMEYATKGAVMSKKYWSSEAIENQTDPDQDIRGRPLTIAKAKQYFRDLVRGLHYLHHHANIVHRDIKPENLLIDKNDTLKITDFNISHMFENTDVVCDSAGTKLYLSPEAWSGSSFRGKPADIWAAGVTLYYFLYGKVPFPPKIGQDIKDIILTKELEFPDNREIDPEAVNLIKACLDKDPNQRITVKELMKDPWITDNGANPLSNEEFGEVSVTLEEIRAALTVKIQTTFMVANQLVKSLNSARSNLQKTKREFDNSFGIS